MDLDTKALLVYVGGFTLAVFLLGLSVALLLA